MCQFGDSAIQKNEIKYVETPDHSILYFIADVLTSYDPQNQRN